MEFNYQQRQAIDTIEGPVIIISCAGSGKTSVILERTNRIIASGVNPLNILVVTFSKMAANEMSERYIKRYGQNRVRFSTIHSLCYSVICNTYNVDQSSLLKESEKQAFLMEEYYTHVDKVSEIKDRDYEEFYKDLCLNLSQMAMKQYEQRQSGIVQEINDWKYQIYEEYTKHKKKLGKLDFDDMIIKCHEILSTNKEQLAYWQKYFKYIMIDEFQDTNQIQAEIFYMISEKNNICVVGDDDQCIYGFRDADHNIFKKFVAHYPECKRIYLETNYRCRPDIIDAAARLIGHNKVRFAKEFKAFRTEKTKILVHEMQNIESQTTQIIEQIKILKRNGKDYRDMAILYRVRKEAIGITSQLALENIPFYSKEPLEDIHKKLVYRDIRAYFRLSNGSWQNTDLQRIINRPQRYIKKQNILECGLNKQKLYSDCCKGITDFARRERIEATIDQLFYDLMSLNGKKPYDFVCYMENQMNYIQGLQAYAEYVKMDSQKFQEEFETLKNEAQRFQSMEEWNIHAEQCTEKLLEQRKKNEKEGICLSTFHGSKGLEWENVFLISANDGKTPLIRNEQIDNPEEERRLFYVAMTRAKDKLDIYYVGGKMDSKFIPSRYLEEIKEKE